MNLRDIPQLRDIGVSGYVTLRIPEPKKLEIALDPPSGLHWSNPEGQPEHHGDQVFKAFRGLGLGLGVSEFRGLLKGAGTW